MPTRLTIEHEHPAPGVVELHVQGEVDLGSGKRLEQELAALVDGGAAVVVNLCGCTFLDSSGLSALIRTARTTAEPGRFAICCLPQGTVRHLFSLTRAHQLLPVHEDRDAAIAAVAA